jgi:hypothetical protein
MYNFLSLEIKDDSFEVKHAITAGKTPFFDFKTNELIEDEFTIKAYDDENKNIYMFNKFTNHLIAHSGQERSYKRLKELNLTYFGGGLDYKCINK